MKIRKPITLIVAFAMVFTVFGYGFTVQADAAAKKPTKMSISSNYKTVDIKGKVTVKVKSVSPANASKAVTWKSSNKNIATVSSSGVVTGKKAGTVKITATSKSNKKLKKTVTIKVKQIKPTLSLKNVYVYMRDGYVAVKASVPSNVYNAGVSYKISSTKYANNASKTSKKGYSSLKARTGYVYISPVKATKNKVTLTATSRENKKIKKTCRVYVRQSVNAIVFSQKSAEAEAGKTITLKASVTKPSKPYSKAVVYTSSDKSVATVDKNGKVTANRPGHAKITATAKYGNRNKAKASYDLEVYDVLEPFESGNQAEYTADMDKYDYYKITGERKSEALNIQLSNDELLNIVGKGNTGFNWMDADEKAFADADFTYSAGNDYMLEKAGDKVTVKFGEGNRITGYYVAGKSFKPAKEAGDYTIILFTDRTGDYELQKIVKAGNAVKAVRDNMK
ncbi:MAG: Ig-like domain-containing protein [Anaerovoracaceae bacterium]